MVILTKIFLSFAGLFTSGLSGLGLGSGAAKVGGRVVAGGLIVLALILAVNKSVDLIGDARENALRLDAAEKTLENIGVADGVDAKLEEADAVDDKALEDVIDDAVEEHPESSGSSVGAASANVHDELRRQAGAGHSQ